MLSASALAWLPTETELLLKKTAIAFIALQSFGRPPVIVQ
jgi:hypothetical protein